MTIAAEFRIEKPEQIFLRFRVFLVRREADYEAIYHLELTTNFGFLRIG